MSEPPSHEILVGGAWETSADRVAVTAPGRDGERVGETFHATREQCERAIAAAVDAFETTRRLPAHVRGDVLRNVAATVLDRRDDLGRLLALEAGKPLADAVTEVERTALAYRVAAEEAERGYGEVIPLDINRASEGRIAVTRRLPLGPVAGITPFNLPLGLSVHKLAPALASGCPIVLKPDSRAPLAVLEIARIIADAGAVPGSVSVLPMTIDVGDQLVTDERFKLLSFTGSAAVGWNLKARAGRKRVVLELGGNAAVVVDASADLDHAARRCAVGAFKYAGQICISVQRIVVDERVWEPFTDRFLEHVRALRLGDVLDPSADIGPMLEAGAVRRAGELVAEATAGGAVRLTNGDPEGDFFPPTVLTDVPVDASAWREEAFAPIAVLRRFRGLDEAFAMVNDSAYGLQAGIFTADLDSAWRAHRELEVGAVIVNDVPTYRVDHMPYGGVKDSGLGREGLRWAIEDMTELRTMVITSAG